MPKISPDIPLAGLPPQNAKHDLEGLLNFLNIHHWVYNDNFRLHVPQVEQHKPLALTGHRADLKSLETCPFLGSVCFLHQHVTSMCLNSGCIFTSA